MEEKGNPNSIKLPDTLEVFRNLKNAKQFAIDIGGSLTKIAYYSTVSFRRVYYAADDINKDSSKTEDDKQDKFVYTYSEQARLHFVKFETKYIENCLDFIGDNLVNTDERKGKSIKATGGGAHKYSKLIQDKLGLSVDKEDELTCLIKGCNFLLKNISDEAFVYHRHGSPEYEFQVADPHVFPYMLVNIGSGVSILKVESDDCYERIGGTATGGGTFWGLGTLLTKAKSFDELLELAEKGDHRKADMLVKDIYGGDYQNLGMHSDLIASSFGKLVLCLESDYNEADLARSLLFSISNDIGQIACLYAMMHNLKKVYFGGYFLRNHSLSMHTISFSINFWSRGTVQSLFLRHEGYLGAIGAFLKGTEECDGDKFSWQENYAGSGSNSTRLTGGKRVDQLELDRWESPLTFCPLLMDPASYIPDTVDLNSDKEAREYWLDCFEQSIENYVSYAVASQPTSDTAKSRSEKFKEKFIARVKLLRIKPFTYGNLTVRGLLDTINHCLKEFDFPDPYLTQKRTENEEALSCLQERLTELDTLNVKNRQVELIMGVLAGNTFDWGAKETVALMKSGQFDFKQARNKVPARPWLMDYLDDWVQKIYNEKYKRIAIFIDNSGFDIVLGILPLAREFLRQGSTVILCANSAPALNDVTHSELVVLLRHASSICPVIAKGLDEGALKSMETAQGGPCLDLSRLGRELANELSTVDLIVLEGMGRAVHTNLDAKFTCDSLKLAIIKNRWLAKRLGGDMFSVVCKYETPRIAKEKAIAQAIL
ncbi:4'-phosphopantetheine phosphatase isoform X2 [Adelges cooleyi]|uniref:4'-phosphopantetheine phosphatase isoform X2 n=1 Tax=Adelges cooleyi TaxID=133065 RepID=UPI00217FE73F|nr:4'-phosphopantetheine phosphatase isoform X2 [Adelges cooleyi]